jgi:hypothetical protein
MKTRRLFLILIAMSAIAITACTQEPEKVRIVVLYDYMGMPEYMLTDVTVLESKSGYIKVKTYSSVIEHSGRYSIEH